MPGLPGLDGVDAIAAGGLIGPDGLAGTGLLANTGDPANSGDSALSGVLVQAGDGVTTLAEAVAGPASGIDGALPGGLGDTGILTAVVDTVDNAGQALADAGNGDGYLVDGLVAAPGPLLTVAAGDNAVIGGNGDEASLISANLVSDGGQAAGTLASVGLGASGGADDNALIGVSLGSAEQNQGTLLTVGAGSGDETLVLATPLLNDNQNLLDTGEGGNVLGGVLNPGGGEGGLVGTVQETVGGVLNPGGGEGGLVGTVQETVGGVLGGVGGGDANGGLVGGLLGGLGGN